MFVKASEAISADMPYRGSAYEQFQKTRRDFFEDM
jgi:hypothetical protein